MEVNKTQIRKLEFKILFQKNSCVDCIQVFKVCEIGCHSVFVLELETVWNPAHLLWSICDLRHAE